MGTNNTSEMLAETLVIFFRSLYFVSEICLLPISLIYMEKTITGLSPVFPSWFLLRSVPPCLVGIFSPLGSETQKPIYLRKVSSTNANPFLLPEGHSQCWIFIQRRRLCLVFVPPLLVSDISELFSEPLHFSIPFLSRTASASWI